MTIRKLPGDFAVEELLTPGRVRPEPGPLLVYRVRKTSLTTDEAVARLAKALGVRAGQVQAAGLKDKHAVTIQHVSVRAPGSPPPTVELPNLHAERVGFTAEPLDASAIAANRFDLVVRDLTRQDVTEMERRAAVLADGRGSLVILNAFGDQRFGSARHGEGFAARRLIAGDFEGALKLLIGTPARKDTGARRALTRAAASHWGDWAAVLAACAPSAERRAVEALAAGQGFREAFEALPFGVQQLAVEAYQSHLWNAAARRFGADLAVAAGVEPLRAEDDFGELLFPPAGAVPEAARGVRMPMPAAGVVPAQPWREAMTAALAEEGVRLDELRVPGLRRPAFGAAPRPLFAAAAGFALGPAERDELASPRSPRNLRRWVRFDLPRGAYATVVLRALGQ